MKRTKEDCLLLNGIMQVDLGNNEEQILMAMEDYAQSEIETLRAEIERLKQGASVVRVRFCPIDTEETFEGKVIHESNYSYVVIPDDNLTGTARWSKKYCEIITPPPSRG